MVLKITVTNLYKEKLVNRLFRIQQLPNILKHRYTRNELISETDGVFIINSNRDKILRVEPSMATENNVHTIIDYIPGTNLLVDATQDKLIDNILRLPTDYLLIKTEVVEYKLDRSNELTFVVEFYDKPITLTNDLKIHENPLDICDFYFLYNADVQSLSIAEFVQNKSIKTEINKFLSLLN